LEPLAPAGEAYSILPTAGCEMPNLSTLTAPAEQIQKSPVATLGKFDGEYRSGLGYHQPAGALASVGVMAAGTGATSSKYVARRETPLYIPENCTQCMECITACPDTALPNTAQDVSTVLTTAINNYVTDTDDRAALLEAVPVIDTAAREKMNAVIAAKEKTPFKEIIKAEVENLNGQVSGKGMEEL
ncbi:MAG: oxidoreductase, partial [bacterium]|nr:oxidoreductase [bacterium]